jgi:hypothetical protein
MFDASAKGLAIHELLEGYPLNIARNIALPRADGVKSWHGIPKNHRLVASRRQQGGEAGLTRCRSSAA